MTDVAQLTRIRIEGSAETKDELVDYLTTCCEMVCDVWGRVWHQPEPMDIQTTRKGFWGRVTLQRQNLDAGKEVKRVMKR